MRITCYYDDACDLGYIYLKPPKDDRFDDYEWSRNEIAEHLNSNQLHIPYVTTENLAPYLDQMKMAPITFTAAHEKDYDTEYGNDLDEHGYLIGIELTLKKNQFLDLVSRQAFKVYLTEWRNKKYHLITFDHSDNVFKPGNVIYKLTDGEDAFVVVQLEQRKNENRPIALFKALISARDDIYPLGYLLKPEFYLSKNVWFQVLHDDLFCEKDAVDIWESIPDEHRKTILGNVYCGHCVDAVKIVDCTIYHDTSGLMLRGRCARCGNRVARVLEMD